MDVEVTNVVIYQMVAIIKGSKPSNMTLEEWTDILFAIFKEKYCNAKHSDQKGKKMMLTTEDRIKVFENERPAMGKILNYLKDQGYTRAISIQEISEDLKLSLKIVEDAISELVFRKFIDQGRTLEGYVYKLNLDDK